MTDGTVNSWSGTDEREFRWVQKRRASCRDGCSRLAVRSSSDWVLGLGSFDYVWQDNGVLGIILVEVKL